MNSKNLIICDAEEKYAQALAVYLTQQKGLTSQVYVCSSPERVADLEKEVKNGILLLSEEYADRENVADKKRCILMSREETEKQTDCPCVYKYQSGEKILDQLFDRCPDWFDTEPMVCRTIKAENKKIIGVFSPIHRTGKTTYALNMGEKLAETENVLYLSLEFFGGIDGHFEKSTQTIADLIYFSRQEKSNIGMLLAPMIHHRGNLDYVAPAEVSEEMKEIKGEEWIRLIEQILHQSIYETLILDIDEGVLGLYQILEICTEIHMPVRNEPYAKAKLCQFEEEAVMLGKEHVLKKIIRKEVMGDGDRIISCKGGSR